MAKGRFFKGTPKSAIGDDDGDNLIDAVTGDSEFNTRHAIQVGQMASSFVPGGTLIGAGLEFGEGELEAKDREKKLARRLGVRRLEDAAYSDAVRRELGRTRNHSWKKVKSFAAQAGGGAIGGAAGGAIIGSFTFPIVGTLGGAWIGSQIAGNLYDRACAECQQDAITLVAQMQQMHENGQNVPPEMAFAALAANIPGKRGKKLEDRLEKLTGTRDFSEAIASGQIDKLRIMRREFELDIIASTGMGYNPDRDASERYADLINSGRMDARALIIDPMKLQMMALDENMQIDELSPMPRHVDLRSEARNLSNAGVTVAHGDKSHKHLPRTDHPHGHSKA